MKGTCQTLDKDSTSLPSGPARTPVLAPRKPAGCWYLHYEAGGRLPLKEQLLFPLVGAQVLLLGTHGITAIDDDEDVGVCPSGKDITGVESDFIRDN